MKILIVVGLGLLGVVYMIKANLPRGIRNNNPGNIRRNSIEWDGMQAIQNDSEFVQFKSPEYGFRAMTRILQSYQRRGLLSVRDMISTYAPSSENHTGIYIDFVSQYINVSPDQPLDLNETQFDLIKAISIFENGTLYSDHYDDKTIEGGIALA